MSFLIDPALLYAGGRTYAVTTPPEERTLGNDLRVGAQTMAFFYAVSVGLYLDHEWTKPIWRPVRAKSGRDWMLNSGVTRFDAAKAGPAPTSSPPRSSRLTRFGCGWGCAAARSPCAPERAVAIDTEAARRPESPPNVGVCLGPSSPC